MVLKVEYITGLLHCCLDLNRHQRFQWRLTLDKKSTSKVSVKVNIRQKSTSKVSVKVDIRQVDTYHRYYYIKYITMRE